MPVRGVAVFGCGRAGSLHLTNLSTVLRRRCKVLYAVDPSPDVRATIKVNLDLDDDVIVVGDDQTEKVLSDPRVECVVVASSTLTHEDIVIRSLKHGKSVFCEKPLSTNLAGIGRCYDEAEKHGVHLFCSFNRRFDPAFSSMWERAVRGDVGKIHSIHSVSRDQPKPSYEYLRTSGGIAHDCIIHDIDLTCQILGEYPTEVFAQGHTHDHVIASFNDHDLVSVIMKFSSGVIITVQISRQACYGYHQTIEIFGDKGMLQSSLMNPGYGRMYSASGHQDILAHDMAGFSIRQRYHESFIITLQKFFDVLDGKIPLPITRQQVVNDCIVADALAESLRTKTVQHLKW